MYRIACLAGFIVLYSFNTSAQAFAGGKAFVGKKFVVTHHNPHHFGHHPHIFLPTPVVTKTFVAPPYIPPYGYVGYAPVYGFPYGHHGAFHHHGVPWGGHSVIILK